MESQPQNPEFRINPENFHPFPVIMKSVFVCLFDMILFTSHQQSFS